MRPTRLVIGPANSAGQGFRWARAVERASSHVSAISVQGTRTGPFKPEVDIRVPFAVYQRSAVWHDRFERMLGEQTHAIWESGLPLLGRRLGSDTMAEMRWASGRGVQPGLMFHGSDIRPPLRHAQAHPWSPYRDASGPLRALERTTRENAEIAATAGVPTFVSTPDLLEWLPGSTWVPVVVDPAAWRVAGSSTAPHRVPVVVHAPTQRWIKGTDLIEPTLERLHAEGVIDYRPLTAVPHAAMPAVYGSADIVLDQFRLGSYGVAACEALAAGRLVMGHVDARTRELVRAETGLELPIHETTIESLEHDLRRVSAQPDDVASLRSLGPAFVEAVHDGRRSAAALAGFLGVSA
ncbi:MAG: hypothetical protein M3Y46_03260 [Actinomycetota bacterium]|nr:hypothetical protein [Actinomycetota bacterium]